VGQGSALSPILLALYIVPPLHLFEHRAQALNLDTFTLSYVDNGLLVSQGRIYNKTLPELTSSYSIVSDLMASFGLVMEHDKLEIFHFSRAHNDSNPELDLSAISAPILKPKTYWRYLGFYFDRQLSFKKHVRFYSTKTLTTVSQGNGHAWQLYSRSPSSTKATSLSVLCCSYCHLWLSTLVFLWSSY